MSQPTTPQRSDAGEQPSDSPELLPVRMLNEFTYCPRLFHLMNIEGRWADNVYTVEGKAVHRRVDRLDHVLPEADAHSPPDQGATVKERSSTSGSPAHGRGSDAIITDDDPPVVTRSVPLGSDRLGLTAKLDLVPTA